MKLNIGLQLYTLRDELHNGLDAVFSKVAEIGYKGIEMLYTPDKGNEISEMLQKYSLTATGAHIGLGEVENNYDVVVDFLKKIGSNKCIVPHVSQEEIKDLNSCAKYAERLEKAAQRLKSDNIEFAFHNHVIEFEKIIDGQTPIDIFYDAAPSLKFEMDMGWAFVAGADICEYIKKIGSRLMVVHIKDIDNNNAPTEVGNGRVDFKAMLADAVKVGVEWGIVEQDICTNHPPFEAIKISSNYLSTINDF